MAFTADDLKLAREFIINDISREFILADVSQDSDKATTLRSWGVPLGGGNFLAALGLLCYTEFAGGVLTGDQRRGYSRKNFEAFYDFMGPAYAAMRHDGLDVYKIFRCEMAHHFAANESIIYMLGDSPAVGIEANGRFFFRVKPYFDDFLKAFDEMLLR